MALVSVMLIMSLMLMLGLAVTFTALSDNSITSNFTNSTKGFYAAEAGIHNLHRLLHSDQFLTASLPNPPKVTPGQPTLNQQNFTINAQQMLSTAEYFPNNSSYKTKLTVTGMTVPFPAGDGTPSHAGNRITLVNPEDPSAGQIEPYSVTYRLDSVGQGLAGLNGTVTLSEEGVIDFDILSSMSSGGLRVGSFAEFALFTDHFDPYDVSRGFTFQGLGPGDRFSGRVHTNERLGFWTSANGLDAPVFKGLVTQSDQAAAYYRYGANSIPPPIDSNSEVIEGVLVAPNFESGFERGVPKIPPPTNAFNQARAVLDGGSSLNASPPTAGELDQSLRAASALNTPLGSPKDPTSTTPDLAPGVYIPTDGQGFTGSGIYVMGDADQVVLTADTTANRQIIRITQGNQTTTISIDIDAGTTTIDAGNGTMTLTGIPMDRSVTSVRPATSLYVRGNIKSIHGPGRGDDGQPLPAIDSEFAVTVTAAAYQSDAPGNPTVGGNMTITGDMTYETPVVDSAGNAINAKAANVLGLFASGGNIEIPIDGSAPDNLTLHASMAAFTMKDASGNEVQGPGGNPIGGRIRSSLNNWESAGNLGRLTVVGGMQSSVYDNFGVYNGTMHGYSYAGLWDPRYDQHQAPPFYPGYVVNLGAPTNVPIVKVQKSNPLVLSYKRIYYGTIPQQNSSPSR
jgi:hypothetical protein